MASPTDDLGFSVALSSDRLEPSRAGACGCASGAGVQHTVFTQAWGRMVQAGPQAAELTASDGQFSDQLGSSVGISSGTARRSVAGGGRSPRSAGDHVSRAQRTCSRSPEADGSMRTRFAKLTASGRRRLGTNWALSICDPRADGSTVACRGAPIADSGAATAARGGGRTRIRGPQSGGWTTRHRGRRS